MGFRVRSIIEIENKIYTIKDFEKFICNAFSKYPQYPLMVRGSKAVIRYHLHVSGSPELQTVIAVKTPNSLAISTEYGFRNSFSRRGHANIGHQQITTILRAYDHGIINPAKVAVVNEPKVEIANPQKTPAEQILEMKKLLDDGIITQEEFDQFKKKVLS